MLNLPSVDLSNQPTDTLFAPPLLWFSKYLLFKLFHVHNTAQGFLGSAQAHVRELSPQICQVFLEIVACQRCHEQRRFAPVELCDICAAHRLASFGTCCSKMTPVLVSPFHKAAVPPRGGSVNW